MGQWGAAELQQLDQRARKGMVSDLEHCHVAVHADPSMFFQLSEMVKKSGARSLELGGKEVERNGAVQEEPDDVDASFVGQAGSDGTRYAIESLGSSGQGFADGLEKRGGRCDLGVGLQAVDEENALAFGLQKAAGLDAPQFLAGVRTENADCFAELGDVEAGGLAQSPEKPDAGWAGKHFAGSPKGGIEGCGRRWEFAGHRKRG